MGHKILGSVLGPPIYITLNAGMDTPNSALAVGALLDPEPY